MSKMSPKKVKKKKQREVETRKKILARRAALRAPQIEEKKLIRKMERIAKLQKDVAGLTQWADDVLLRMSDDTLSQLERNAKILKGLEEEYEKERAKKQVLNNDLEAKGLVGLEEKLNFLKHEMEQQITESNGEKEICSKRSEVAEVTVTKAPDFKPDSDEF